MQTLGKIAGGVVGAYLVALLCYAMWRGIVRFEPEHFLRFVEAAGSLVKWLALAAGALAAREAVKGDSSLATKLTDLLRK